MKNSFQDENVNKIKQSNKLMKSWINGFEIKLDEKTAERNSPSMKPDPLTRSGP